MICNYNIESHTINSSHTNYIIENSLSVKTNQILVKEKPIIAVLNLLVDDLWTGFNSSFQILGFVLTKYILES